MLRRDVHIPEELFSVHFVQFTRDVFNGVFKSRNDDVFYGIDATIRRTDNLIEYHERRLQRRELDQSFDRLRVNFLRTENLLAATPETREVEVFTDKSEAIGGRRS